MTDLVVERATLETADRERVDLEPRLEDYRSELTGYCYRMLGSAFDAEDAVQETLVRAWRALDRFEGRAALRSWLYRIATNVCLDMLNGRQRRALPMDMGPASTADSTLGPTLSDGAWVEPMPDARLEPTGGDPAELAVARESIRLAFVAALQHLPPRQRAVLILREVLSWHASEVAELLETSVASVNSALQRARATLATSDVDGTSSDPLDDEKNALLARYVDAFERYDMDSLTSLLHEDASWSMPPYELWLQTHLDVVRWCLGPGIGCRGSRLIADVGERNTSVRPVQARAGRRLGAMVPAGGRHRGRSDQGDHLLPRHGSLVPALRPAAADRRLGRIVAGEDIFEPNAHDQLAELRRRPPETDMPTEPLNAQRQPRKGIDRARVGSADLADIAHEKGDVAGGEDEAGALAQRGPVDGVDGPDDDQHVRIGRRPMRRGPRRRRRLGNGQAGLLSTVLTARGLETHRSRAIHEDNRKRREHVKMDWKLELVAVPVSDVDRAKSFYTEKAGFVLDHDHVVSDELRFIQLTPPGSACSITIGKGISTKAPGSVEGLQLVVSDIDAARAELLERGVDVGEVQDFPWGRFVFFTDPDGNGWAVQQIPPRD